MMYQYITLADETEITHSHIIEKTTSSRWKFTLNVQQSIKIKQ